MTWFFWNIFKQKNSTTLDKTFKWVTWTSHVTGMRVSCHTLEHGTPHVWMRHVTLKNKSLSLKKALKESRDSLVNESCPMSIRHVMYDRDVSHVNGCCRNEAWSLEKSLKEARDCLESLLSGKACLPPPLVLSPFTFWRFSATYLHRYQLDLVGSCPPLPPSQHRHVLLLACWQGACEKKV